MFHERLKAPSRKVIVRMSPQKGFFTERTMRYRTPTAITVR
jgi:hypothetical protein